MCSQIKLDCNIKEMEIKQIVKTWVWNDNLVNELYMVNNTKGNLTCKTVHQQSKLKRISISNKYDPMRTKDIYMPTTITGDCRKANSLEYMYGKRRNDIVMESVT